jgi:hypothetical protein
MEVVRPELLAGIDLVHASADELGAEPRTELGLSNPEAPVLLFVVTVVGRDVGDLLPRKTSAGAFRPGSPRRYSVEVPRHPDPSPDLVVPELSCAP